MERLKFKYGTDSSDDDHVQVPLPVELTEFNY